MGRLLWWGVQQKSRQHHAMQGMGVLHEQYAYEQARLRKVDHARLQAMGAGAREDNVQGQPQLGWGRGAQEVLGEL